MNESFPPAALRTGRDSFRRVNRRRGSSKSPVSSCCSPKNLFWMPSSETTENESDEE